MTHKQRRILIADMTNKTLSSGRKDVDVISLPRAGDPEIFIPYDVIILTAQIPSIPDETVFVKDYINASGTNPLMGKNRDDLGLRFPDMSYVFSPPKSQNLSPVIVTAGDISQPGAIRCDPLVWNAILASHQKKKIIGLIYRCRETVETVIEKELTTLLG